MFLWAVFGQVFCGVRTLRNFVGWFVGQLLGDCCKATFRGQVILGKDFEFLANLGEIARTFPKVSEGYYLESWSKVGRLNFQSWPKFGQSWQS